MTARQYEGTPDCAGRNGVRKLTKAQREVLTALSAEGIVEMSAYRLGCSLATLWALQKNRLVQPMGGIGSMAFPRNMGWRITAAGRAAIAKAEGRS